MKGKIRSSGLDTLSWGGNVRRELGVWFQGAIWFWGAVCHGLLRADAGKRSSRFPVRRFWVACESQWGGEAPKAEG